MWRPGRYMVAWVRCRTLRVLCTCAVAHTKSGAIAVPVCSPVHALFGHTMSLNSPNTFLSTQHKRSTVCLNFQGTFLITHLTCISEMVFECFGVKEESPSPD